MHSTDAIVRAVLAHHLERDATKIYPWLRLQEDLDVTPLELVLVALEIEEIEHRQLPFDELAGAHTVGDLLTFFSREVERETLIPA
jgi:acyl carrier protein